MKFAKYFIAILITFAVSGSQDYLNELKLLKKSVGYKNVFDLESNQDLRKIRRDINNYQQMDSIERSLYSVLLAQDTFAITEKTMPKLFSYIKDICEKSNIKVPTIFITSTEGILNAFATKLFATKGAILITQKIIKQSTDEELEAIVAHEIGHIKHNHVNKTIALNLLANIAAHQIANKILGENRSWLANIATYMAGSLVTSFLISKRFEKQADAFACSLNKEKGIIGFFEKIEKRHDKNNQDFVDVRKELSDNKAKLSFGDNLKLNARYYTALISNKINNAFRAIYHHTPLGAHPSPKYRINKAKESLKRKNISI